MKWLLLYGNPVITHKFRNKQLQLVLQQWLWSPLHWSHCVANCLYYFLFLQDTVIALQALAAYGKATYNPASQNGVKITSKKPFEKVFIVNNENRLLLQQTPLPEVPGKYSLTINGSGCVFMQVNVCFLLHWVSHFAYKIAIVLMIFWQTFHYFS